MKRFVVFVLLTMVVIGSCAVQSATNEAQKLVGTWVAEDDRSFALNANGTGTYTYGEESISIFWGVSASGGLYTTSSGESTVYFSPDGRRMIYRGVVFQKR